MLKEIYCIPPDESRYKPNVVEIESELDTIIQQVDMILFTKQGEVLMAPEFGVNLEKYLFETNWNSEVIKNIIREQIRNYVYVSGSYTVDVDVNFIHWAYNVAMIVDLSINNRKIASYLV